MRISSLNHGTSIRLGTPAKVVRLLSFIGQTALTHSPSSQEQGAPRAAFKTVSELLKQLTNTCLSLCENLRSLSVENLI